MLYLIGSAFFFIVLKDNHECKINLFYSSYKMEDWKTYCMTMLESLQ